MNSNFSSSFSRRGPDNITEELVAVLSGTKSYEFKALFLVIQAAIGKSGDEGLDGIIKEYRLGLDIIYVQAADLISVRPEHAQM